VLPFLILEVDESQDRLVLAVKAPPEALPVVRDFVRSFVGDEIVA
jgi:hypothetical protein